MSGFARLVGIAFGCAVMLGLVAAGLSQEPAWRSYLTAIKSQKEATRIDACRQVIDERKAMVKDLTAILEAKSPSANWLDLNTTEGVAIQILGEMRAVEAVPLLMKWAEPPREGWDTSGYGPTCPAEKALVKIGKPAEPALLYALGMKPEVWDIRLNILKEIEGPKCAAVVLEEAIAKVEAGAPAKENLQAALKKLKEEK